MIPAVGGKKGWCSHLLNVMFVITGVMLILLLAFFAFLESFCAKVVSIEEIKENFPENQIRLEGMIEHFAKLTSASSVVGVSSNGDGTYSIDILANGVRTTKTFLLSDFNSITQDESDIKNFIESLNKFQPATKISISQSDPKFFTVSYHTGCKCAWIFERPTDIQNISQLADTVFMGDHDGEGPYILSDKWLVYRYCAG